MAFSLDGLSRIGGSGNSRTVWCYASIDNQATVCGSGYFNSMSNEMAVGDLVLIVDTDAPAAAVSFVKTNSAGVVDLASGTAIADV